MRIEKFEKRQLISGPVRSLARRVVLGALLPLEALEWILGRRRRYVIILGHMRAGSSLLTNVIAQSDEASGYGETFTTYTSGLSFHLLLARIRLHRMRHGRLTVPGEIVVDKALHNKLTPRPEVLAHPQARFVFLIREGERSVESMMHEFGVTEQIATDYYMSRLEHLGALAESLRSRGRLLMLLTFEELTAEREQALERLGRFLGLQHPLSARFKAAPGASRPGAGDPSGRLSAGEILQTQRRLDAKLSDETRESLAAAYRRAHDQLSGAEAAATGAI